MPKKKPSKKQIVLETIKDLTREKGRCFFDIKAISKQSGVSLLELWDWDKDKGILFDLNDSGYIVVERAQQPLIALDSEVLC